MKKMRLMLVAVCLLSASVASAAITTGVIDFASGTVGDYSDLSGWSANVVVTGGQGGWDTGKFFKGQNVIQFDFAQAVRFTGIDLGSASNSPDMIVTGILGGVDTLLFAQDNAAGQPLTNYPITDTTAYDSIKIQASAYDGRIDNIAYNYGEVDPIPEPPAPTPVPAPGALVLAGIGSCFASWMRKRKMA